VNVIAWLGNNELCYRRAKKLVFNHAVWYVYRSQMTELDPPPDPVDDDYDDEEDEETMQGRSAAFMMMDY
jgi:hypothetical protein